MPSAPRLPRAYQRYTHFVHVSKFGLGVLIVVILVFMIAVPLIGHQKSGIRVAFGSIEEKADTPPVMLNPKFQGVDNNNRPYLVRADTAMQSGQDTIVLERVSADLSTTQTDWLTLAARQGILSIGQESLLLQGGVQLYHSRGEEMYTEEVRIDLSRLSAFGESPIQVQGGFGHIRADRFAVLDKGRRMVFNGDVYVLLLP